MKARLAQSILLAAGLALSMSLHADESRNLTRECDELGAQKGDVQQERKRDKSCAEPMRSQVEEAGLPVSGETSRNRERNNNPDASPTTTPTVTPTPSGRGGR